jgi:histidinol dehydrogenase
MKIIENPSVENWAALAQRPSLQQIDLSGQVKTVFDEVQKNGDAAIRQYTLAFDKVDLADFWVSEQELEACQTQLSPELIAAIKQAKSNIEKFHATQKEKVNVVETTQGVRCWRESRAIESVGLYIPSGSAPLFSTVLMLGVPAQLAGCQEIVLCSPPNAQGEIHPAILFAAQLVGIRKILKIGGIQAIAALTFGTETVAKVAKIFGPGNQYVTAAKQAAQNYGVAIDMPAGPSEVLVIADKNSNPEFVAADLLSQAEHGADSQVMLLSDNLAVLQATISEIKAQLAALPRQGIAEKAIENSRFILLNSLAECLAFSNLYAPEHLILAFDDAKNYTANIRNAGSVFLGKYSCESAGDYASGTNHTLPTYGYARNYSGVSLDSFLKKITFQELSAAGIQNIGKTIEVMAEAEQLFAHKNAVSVRLKSLANENLPEEKFDLANFVRPNILSLAPYSSARDEYKSKSGVFLDANENPFGTLNRYPDANPIILKTALSAFKNVPVENIFIGNGSDEGIDLALRIFCTPENDSIIICPPTYGMYEVLANINHLKTIEIPLTADFQLDIAQILNTDAKMLFLCSPNNPTGNNLQNLETVIKNFEGIVFLDEAYIDFSAQESFLQKLSKYPNLIISQTFSKAWGLAAARIGTVYASKEIIALYQKVKPPYNLSSLNQKAALEALANPNFLTEKVAEILAQREILINACQEMDMVKKIYPSDANFILMEVSNAQAIYDALITQKIIVRNRNSVVKNCIRISIGTPEENTKLIQALQNINKNKI